MTSRRQCHLGWPAPWRQAADEPGCPPYARPKCMKCRQGCVAWALPEADHTAARRRPGPPQDFRAATPQGSGRFPECAARGAARGFASHRPHKPPGSHFHPCIPLRRQIGSSAPPLPGVPKLRHLAKRRRSARRCIQLRSGWLPSCPGRWPPSTTTVHGHADAAPTDVLPGSSPQSHPCYHRPRRSLRPTLVCQVDSAVQGRHGWFPCGYERGSRSGPWLERSRGQGSGNCAFSLFATVARRILQYTPG